MIFLLKMLGVIAFYALVSYVNHFLFESRLGIGIAEPACGLALAILLIGGRQYAWGIFFGSLLVNAVSGEPFWAAATVAAGNTLEALVAAWFFIRFGNSDLRLQSMRSYFLLILAGGIGGIICALT